jgi:hypothetical protein
MLFEQKTFQGERVILDGNDYKACDFRDCSLVSRCERPRTGKTLKAALDAERKSLLAMLISSPPGLL